MGNVVEVIKGQDNMSGKKATKAKASAVKVNDFAATVAAQEAYVDQCVRKHHETTKYLLDVIALGERLAYTGDVQFEATIATARGLWDIEGSAVRDAVGGLDALLIGDDAEA